MKPFLLLVVLVVVACLFTIVSAGTRAHRGAAEEEQQTYKAHKFEHEVNANATQFGREHQGDKQADQEGSYPEALQDGRNQTVEYTADPLDGYKTNVTRAGGAGSDSDSASSSDSDSDSDSESASGPGNPGAPQAEPVPPAVTRALQILSKRRRPGHVPVFKNRPILQFREAPPAGESGSFAGEPVKADSGLPALSSGSLVKRHGPVPKEEPSGASEQA